MDKHSTYEERRLLISIAKGDTHAFHALYTHYRQGVYQSAMRILQSQHRAEDLLQEVFLKVWVHREKLPLLDNFGAWLNTVTRNHIYNTLRKQAHEELILEKIELRTAESNAALEELSLRELQDVLRKVTETLTPQQRKVFELSRMQGLKHDEIATELNISSETVKKHISEALRVIRGHLVSYRALPRAGVLLLFLFS